MINHEALVKNRSRLKARLRSRKPVFGAWNSLRDAQITEIFARSQVDFISLDIEHSTIDYKDALEMMKASQSQGVPCLPRIASHNMEMIKRLLEAGADGIIAPMVESREDVENLVRWIKYPKVGKRSFGINRAQGYGFDFDSYVKTWNDSSIFIAQVESIKGVENIEAIVSHPEVDGVMVGPYDISGSIGVPGQLDHPSVLAAAQRIVEASQRSGIACGTHLVEAKAEQISASLASQFTFVVLSSDIFLLWKWADQIKSLVRHHHENA